MLKDARTTTSALICAVQAAAPPQAPPHPAKLNPESGMAVSCTAVPSSKAAVQLLPQSIPPGAERTLPRPSTSTVNVRRAVRAKVAVIVLSPSSVSVQSPMPEHAPPHPVKLAPVSGAACSVSLVPESSRCVQPPRQSLPMPRTAPSPWVLTASTNCVVVLD